MNREQLIKDVSELEARCGETTNRDLVLQAIKLRVCVHYDVKLWQMDGKSREASIVLPRHVAMYFARKLTDLSLSKIGEQFGHRDHGTVLHAFNRIQFIRDSNPKDFSAAGITYLEEELRKMLEQPKATA